MFAKLIGPRGTIFNGPLAGTPPSFLFLKTGLPLRLRLSLSPRNSPVKRFQLCPFKTKASLYNEGAIVTAPAAKPRS